MSHNEEFDELARRKLEERQVAFQEADWQAARKLIDAERGGRNRGAWIVGAVALLLISGLVWYGTSSTGTTGTVAAIEQVAPRTTNAFAAEQPVQNTTAPTPEAQPKAIEPASATNVKALSIQSIRYISDPVHQVDRPNEATTATNTTAKKSTARNRVERNTAKGDQPKAIPSKKNTPHTAQAAVPEEETKEGISPLEPTVAKPEVQAATPSLSNSGNESPQDGPNDPEVMSTQQKPVNSNVIPVTIADQPDKRIEQTGNSNTDDQLIAAEVQTPTVDSASEVAPPSIATPEAPVQPKAGTASSPSDTTIMDAASITPPGDSAIAAAVAGTPPPLVPDRAPWEVSVMSGLFSSSTKYSGSNSKDWNAGIGKKNSIGIGAELMHVGRNFGIGTGLHYSTYAEQLSVGAFDRSTATLHNFWFLMAVDTMVLVITDTIAGDPPTYTGTSTNTTVNVLTQGTDTTITTERTREARTQLNRASYLEVPLLLDAHLTQGRWSFGLRGGPTLGLLTGRRGAVPAPDSEGYVSFTDEPFRQLVFGYTARAYVRFRFNAAWSIGIQPAMRGQLMNSLGSGELSRRASAKGVMLSLSYRLR